MLYQSFNWEPPEFAHFPMILGIDRGRLSKRHGAVSVLEYRKQGYLPEALVNYLALLGWGTTESEEIFASEGLIKNFSLERCGKSAAIFDLQKLVWLNSLHIRQMPIEKLYLYAREELEKAKLLTENTDENYIKNAILLEQEKIKLLTDIPNLLEFFFKEDIVYREEAINKVIRKEGTDKILDDLAVLLNAQENFNAGHLEEIVRKYCQEKNLSTKQVFHPLRVAVSGKTEGPSLFHMLELLGKERVIKRIEQAKGMITQIS